MMVELPKERAHTNSNYDANRRVKLRYPTALPPILQGNECKRENSLCASQPSSAVLVTRNPELPAFGIFA